MADWYVSSATYASVAAWAATTAYTVGQFIKPLTLTQSNRYVFRCTTAGTSGASEPAWTGTATNDNATVTSGTATFTNVSGQSAYGWTAAAGNLFSVSFSVRSGGYFVAGDRVFVSSDHGESLATINYLNMASSVPAPGNIKIISVNRAGSVPPVPADVQSGAAVTITAGHLFFEAGLTHYYQGFSFTLATGATAGNIQFTNNTYRGCYFKDCAFAITNTNSASRYICNGPIQVIFDNTTIQFGHVGQRIANGAYTLELIWLNTPSAIKGAILPTVLCAAEGYAQSSLVCRGVDFSVLTGTLVATASGFTAFKALFDSCRINPSVTRYSPIAIANVPQDVVELVNCFDGTNVINERHTQAGDVTVDRNIYLNSGAQDDIGTYSLKLISNANPDKQFMSLDSFGLDVQNTAISTAKTATVEIISLNSLNNDDIQLLLEYMGGVSIFTTFNPADISNVALSNGNLLATVGAGNGGVRGTNSLSSGKYYWEYTYTTLNSNGISVGISLATASLTGASGTGIAFIARTTGGITVNGTGSGSALGIIAQGTVVGLAVDFTAKLIWFRFAPSGNWNGSGTANPATGVGGVDISSISTGPLFASMFGQTGDAILGNFGASAFVGVLPSGFSPGFGIPPLSTTSPVASFNNSFPSVLTPVAALPSSSNTWTVGSQLVTWSPTDRAALTTLSNGNLTLTSNSTNTGGRATNGFSSGKIYYEVPTVSTTGYTGFARDTTTFNGTTMAAVLAPGSGWIQVNGSSVLNIGAGLGNVGVAVDMTANLIWFRSLPSGNWNGNATYNPATSVGGISISAIAGGPLFPAVTGMGGSDVVTANFGASAFSGTIPSGFVSPNTAITPTIKQLLRTSFTPQRVGRVRGLARLGKASTTVWVNPQVAIS